MTVRHGCPEWTYPEIERAKQLWAELGTKKKAAEAFGTRPPKQVLNMFDSRRIRMDAAPRMGVAERRRRVREYFLREWTVPRMSRELGFSEHTIRDDLKAIGKQPELIARNRATSVHRCRIGYVTRCRDEKQHLESVRRGWPPVSSGLRRWLEALERLGGFALFGAWRAAAGGTRTYHYPIWKLVKLGYVLADGRHSKKRYRFSAEVAEMRRVYHANRGYDDSEFRR